MLILQLLQYCLSIPCIKGLSEYNFFPSVLLVRTSIYINSKHRKRLTTLTSPLYTDTLMFGMSQPVEALRTVGTTFLCANGNIMILTFSVHDVCALRTEKKYSSICIKNILH